jgi:hypothetical protein
MLKMDSGFFNIGFAVAAYQSGTMQNHPQLPTSAGFFRQKKGERRCHRVVVKRCTFIPAFLS